MPCPTRRLATPSRQVQHYQEQKHSSLLDLPPEIRTSIFELILRLDEPLQYTCLNTRSDGRPSCSARLSPEPKPLPFWALLLANKLIHAEVAWMLTSLNMLHFSSLQAVKCFRGRHVVSPPQAMPTHIHHALVPASAAQVENLESLVLDFVKFRRKDFVKLFRALGPLGRLRRVVLMTHKRRKIDARLAKKVREALPGVVECRVEVSDVPLEDTLHGP